MVPLKVCNRKLRQPPQVGLAENCNSINNAIDILLVKLSAKHTPCIEEETWKRLRGMLPFYGFMSAQWYQQE
ncbi:MAG: hypothetical protein ACTS77_01065 [Arsenophonus sp. NC-TX2-MAG3]